MLRVCGAPGEQSATFARRCWCGGLFCYRGGQNASKEFRRDFRSAVPALSYRDFEELIRQQSLFGDNELREKWIARVKAHAAPASRVDRKRIRRDPRAAETEDPNGNNTEA